MSAARIQGTEDAASPGDIAATMTALGRNARRAADELAEAAAETRDAGLASAAESIRDNAASILAENARDVEAGRERALSAAMLDRLLLNDERVTAMADGIDAIRDLDDPVGKVLARWQRPNGLDISRVSVPLGVIGIIYESRPNVTADAAALCLKSGNAVILRGGSESFHSSRCIHRCLVEGIAASGLPADAAQMVPTTDREAVGFMLSSMREYVDVVVPRGGKRLIERVMREARVPVIGHLEGICHVYLHESADTDMATQITLNAKMRRTGICGAAETLLVDRAAADRLLPPVLAALSEAGCEIRGDDAVRDMFPAAESAKDADWSTEYLDAIISVRVVDGDGEAIRHIREFGSGHTECIVADDVAAAEAFTKRVDSAIVLHNASTQFADGGEFGMGAEIGIATDRIHARGPVGAEQLTSYKYVVRGQGQTRS